MSLLLDALKKAADDKQKASQAGVTRSGSISESTEELTLQATDDVQDAPEALSVNRVESSEELMLDVDEPGISDANANDSNEYELMLDEEVPAYDSNLANNDQEKKEPGESGPENNKKVRTSNISGLTVSDDALSMLIKKTNRDVKRDKTVFYVSALMVSLTILVSGGVYYYQDMQIEIADLERKHQIAMQSMRLKTSSERTPEKSEIIRSLVSESGANEKVQHAKQYLASEKSPLQASHKPNIQTEKKERGVKATAPVLSIKKTNKSDPVGEKLDVAWLAYESGRYGEAKKIYKEVISVEEKNRDALLGLGAIAVTEKNNSVAREIYLSLLKQDPRDPIATAALAGLHSGESPLKSDENYMLSMLQKNSNAPHLNFAMGNIYAQQKKWKSAQQYYFNAWQHDNENADYIFNLAVSMDQLNKQQQAVSFYKDSLLKSVNKQVSFSREAVQKRINELSGL